MIGLGDLVTRVGAGGSGTQAGGEPPAKSPSWAGATALDTTQGIMDGFILAGMWQDPAGDKLHVPVSRADGILGIPVGSTSSQGCSTRGTFAPL